MQSCGLATLLLVLLPPPLIANEAQNKDVAWLQYYKGAEAFRDDQWKRDIWPRYNILAASPLDFYVYL